MKKAYKKHKKWLMYLFAIIILFIIVSFLSGYKIPHSDKHKNWSNINEYNDKELEVKKVLYVSSFAAIENENKIIAITDDSGNKGCIINDKGNILQVLNGDSELSAFDMRHYPRIGQPNFSIADDEIVIGNDFDFSLGLDFSGSPGAAYRKTYMEFDQQYLEYLAIKLKSKIFYFKMNFQGRIEDLGYSFIQLNIPESDNDTLAFVYDRNLYQAYLKK